FNLDFAHDGLQDATAYNALRLADKVKGYMHLDLRRKVNFVKIRMNNITGNRVVLHILHQSHFSRQCARAGLQPDQMRTFESSHTARKFSLVKFQRNRWGFGAIQNTGNLSVTAQSASLSFAVYFACLSLNF